MLVYGPDRWWEVPGVGGEDVRSVVHRKAGTGDGDDLPFHGSERSL